MQPYFFPYIGYWQLIHAVDRFVIYDDVNYIKGGWINRNRILINGAPHYISVPLYKSSPNKRIFEISIQDSPDWRHRMVKTIDNAYRNAEFFEEVFPVIEGLIVNRMDTLAEYLAQQIRVISEFIGIKSELIASSRHYGNSDLCGQSRVLDICKCEGASIYINAQGGQALYNSEIFCDAGIDLRFLVTRPMMYRQRVAGFLPHLSIIDVLMEIGPAQVRRYLDEYDLIKSSVPA